jgi:hypothetical protein
MNDPKAFPSATGVKLKTGLSTASLVLGILSMVCFLMLTGIPAIITGHIARSRAKRQPDVYGGSGMALAGLILGYLSIPLTIVSLAIAAALVLPAMAKAKGRNQTTSCVNNLKQIGLAARIWSNEHKEIFPPDFVSMSNELVKTSLLICPQDGSKTPATDFTQFNPAQNVSYEFLTPNAKEADITAQIAFRCPIHGNVALGDGSVQQKSGKR